VASIPIIYQEEKEKLSRKTIIYFVLGFVVVLIFGYLNSMSGEKKSIISVTKELSALYGFKLFISGLLAAGTMVVPGVSGSLLLLLLGEYYNVLAFINDRNLIAIGIIGVGAVCGIVIFARVIDYLLKKNRTMTMFFILGLVTASAVEVFPGVTMTVSNVIIDLLVFVLGFALVMLVKNLDERDLGGN
jgi:putative membrane protein